MNISKSIRRPDIIVIGAQKAGTSWFYEVFSQRPDVWSPPVKELHYFDHKFLPSVRSWTNAHITSGITTARAGLQKKYGDIPPHLDVYLENLACGPRFTGRWYKDAFSIAPPQSRLLDVTPEYSMIPRDGVEFMNRFLPPTTRFIYIVRDPVSRALSHLSMKLGRSNVKPASIADWLHAARDPMLRNKAIYSEYVPRWQSVMGSRMLLISYKTLKENPVEFLRKIEDFLGLSPWNYKNPERVVKKTPSIEIPLEVKMELEKILFDQSQFVVKKLQMGG